MHYGLAKKLGKIAKVRGVFQKSRTFVLSSLFFFSLLIGTIDFFRKCIHLRSAEIETKEINDKKFFIVNAILSAAALSFLAYILILRKAHNTHANLNFLPAVNASLNALSATLLVLGYRAIRARKKQLHRSLMVSAFIVSSMFLMSYVVYHYTHGDTRFQGYGTIRIVYFFILISHILLSAFIVPLVLTTFYFAWKQKWKSHRRIAKITLPIWLYVSVTGVLIYFLLKSYSTSF